MLQANSAAVKSASGTQVANRRRVRLAIGILLLATAAAGQQYGSPWRPEYEDEKNGPHGECKVEWRHVSSGLDYRHIDCLGDRDDLDLHVVRVDQKFCRLDVAVVPGGGAARRVADDKNAGFVINTNFFDHRRSPLGVLVRSGDEVQRAKSTSWQSIFLIDADGLPQIIDPGDWPKYRKFAWLAVQAGPRLVTAGHTARVHQSYSAERAGVCINKRNELLFFATPRDRKFDMYEIARIARRGEIDGGLECRDAMLFDGGHSTQIYLEGGRTQVSVAGDDVPAFIYAVKR
jgi:uncharacterized protein YigE (DUF2233 family)